VSANLLYGFERFILQNRSKAWLSERGVKEALTSFVQFFIRTTPAALEHAVTDIPIMSPEQAYPLYDVWRPTMAMPVMDLATFTRHYSDQRRLYRGHLKGLHPIIGPAGQILAPAVIDP
jgi:hypothetical protein